MILRVGSTFRDVNGILIKVIEVIQHPKFNPDTFDYDFSLLRFEVLLKFNSFVQPVKLARPGEVLMSGTVCNVSGWGLTENFEIPRDLRATQVSISERLKCKQAYDIPEIQFEVTDRMICAGEANPKGPSGNKDSCSGDSGGPLVCNGVQYGVVSSGSGCGLSDFPGVYSYLPSVRSWILQVTGT